MFLKMLLLCCCFGLRSHSLASTMRLEAQDWLQLPVFVLYALSLPPDFDL